MDAREVLAKAIYEGRNGPGCILWHRVPVLHKAPYLLGADTAIAAIASLPLPERLRVAAVPENEQRYRHKKRGGIYEVIGTAELQMAFDLVDGSEMAVYRGEDGRLWVRQIDEFHDGRFEKIAAAPAHAEKDKAP